MKMVNWHTKTVSFVIGNVLLLQSSFVVAADTQLTLEQSIEPAWQNNQTIKQYEKDLESANWELVSPKAARGVALSWGEN